MHGLIHAGSDVFLTMLRRNQDKITADPRAKEVLATQWNTPGRSIHGRSDTSRRPRWAGGVPVAQPPRAGSRSR